MLTLNQALPLATSRALNSDLLDQLRYSISKELINIPGLLTFRSRLGRFDEILFLIL